MRPRRLQALANRWTPRLSTPRENSPKRRSEELPMSNAVMGLRRSSSMDGRSTDSTGADRWRAFRIYAAASQPILGLGYTEVPADADLSPVNQCEMIVTVMDALKIDNADLVSNDSATAIAQLLAARHPDRVRSMLITNGDVHTNSPPETLKPTIEEARQGLLIERLEKQLLDPRIGQTSEGLGVVYTNPVFVTPELLEVYLRPLVSSPTKRRQCQDYGVAFEPNPLPAIEQELKNSRIPARILWGTGDELFPREWAQWLDRTLPKSQGVRYVEGAKLFFTEEFPEIVAEEARRLWAAA